MTTQEIVNRLILYIESSFNTSSVSISGQSTLSDFNLEENPLEFSLFLTEVDLDFWVDLEQVYGDKLPAIPIFKIAEHLKNNIK